MSQKIGFVGVAATVLAVAGWAASARAAMIYEGFSGYSPGVLTGQTATGTGLAGQWATSYTYNTTTDTAWSAVSPGLSFGSLPVSGGAAYTGAINNMATSDAVALASDVSGTVWGSYLFSYLPNNSWRVSLFLQSAKNNSNGNTAYRMEGITSNAVTARVTVGNASAASGNLYPTSGSTFETYLVVYKLTNVGSGTATTDGTAEEWVVADSSALDGAIADGSLTQSELNSIAVWDSGVVQSTNNTDTTFSNLTLGRGLGNGQGYIDEIRIDPTLNGALGLVPEPATLGLLLVGGLATIIRRRRRA